MKDVPHPARPTDRLGIPDITTIHFGAVVLRGLDIQEMPDGFPASESCATIARPASRPHPSPDIPFDCPHGILLFHSLFAPKLQDMPEIIA